jgi:hypothetical protein
MCKQEHIDLSLISLSSSSDDSTISTKAIVASVVGSILLVALLLGIGIFLCLRGRSKKRVINRSRVDLDTDEQAREIPRATSIFSPFEYHPAPPASTTEDVSGYSLSGFLSNSGAHITTSNASSQPLLSPRDSASNNPQSSHSSYSRDTFTSASQWGETPSARNSAVVPTPRTSSTPAVPPIREKTRLVMTNPSEGGLTSPRAVNWLPPGAAFPPPYSPK